MGPFALPSPRKSSSCSVQKSLSSLCGMLFLSSATM